MLIKTKIQTLIKTVQIVQFLTEQGRRLTKRICIPLEIEICVGKKSDSLSLERLDPYSSKNFGLRPCKRKNKRVEISDYVLTTGRTRGSKFQISKNVISDRP